MPSSGERPRRARIGLADAPLEDYRPHTPPPPAATHGPDPSGDARARGAGGGTARTPVDPRRAPRRLAEESSQSVNFHIPRSLDRTLSRLKYELEIEYGVRTSKTALAAAALHAFPQEPLEALALLRAYEAAEIPSSSERD